MHAYIEAPKVEGEYNRIKAAYMHACTDSPLMSGTAKDVDEVHMSMRMILGYTCRHKGFAIVELAHTYM